MKRFFAGLIILGMVILFGTAGASDIGSIGVGQACVQGIASVGFLFAGMLGMKVCHIEEVRKRRAHRAQEMHRYSSGEGTYVLNGSSKMKKTA